MRLEALTVWPAVSQLNARYTGGGWDPIPSSSDRGVAPKPAAAAAGDLRARRHMAALTARQKDVLGRIAVLQCLEAAPPPCHSGAAAYAET